MQSLIARMMAPTARRLRLMVARAVVTAINDAGSIQTAQVKLLDGEVRDGVEILHQYGFTSHPPGKREGAYLSVGGDRDNGVMICVADRQFRLKALVGGEVALYDDLNQKVHLTRTGIVIDGAGKPVLIQNTPKVRIESELEVTKNIKDHCDDSSGKTMAGMREAHNNHDHDETQAVTKKPNQKM